LPIVANQELSNILALRPPAKYLLQERDRLGAVPPSAVMVGKAKVVPSQLVTSDR